MLRRNLDQHNELAIPFYIIPIGDLALFSPLVFFAYRLRRQPAAHKRLIMIATIACMGAPLFRFPIDFLNEAFNVPPHGVSAIACSSTSSGSPWRLAPHGPGSLITWLPSPSSSGGVVMVLMARATPINTGLVSNTPRLARNHNALSEQLEFWDEPHIVRRLLLRFRMPAQSALSGEPSRRSACRAGGPSPRPLSSSQPSALVIPLRS